MVAEETEESSAPIVGDCCIGNPGSGKPSDGDKLTEVGQTELGADTDTKPTVKSTVSGDDVMDTDDRVEPQQCAVVEAEEDLSADMKRTTELFPALTSPRPQILDISNENPFPNFGKVPGLVPSAGSPSHRRANGELRKLTSEEIQAQTKLDTFREGLLLKDCASVTALEVYMMMGCPQKVVLEYDLVEAEQAEGILELNKLTNMLRRLVHLASTEFIDFKKSKPQSALPPEKKASTT